MHATLLIGRGTYRLQEQFLWWDWSGRPMMILYVCIAAHCQVGFFLFLSDSIEISSVRSCISEIRLFDDLIGISSFVLFLHTERMHVNLRTLCIGGMSFWANMMPWSHAAGIKPSFKVCMCACFGFMALQGDMLMYIVKVSWSWSPWVTRARGVSRWLHGKQCRGFGLRLLVLQIRILPWWQKMFGEDMEVYGTVDQVTSC